VLAGIATINVIRPRSSTTRRDNGGSTPHHGDDTRPVRDRTRTEPARGGNSPAMPRTPLENLREHRGDIDVSP